MRDFISLTESAMNKLELQVEQDRVAVLRATLQLVLDAADYTAGACKPNEMIGAVLPKNVIETIKNALEKTK